jgi:hypothetical protein
MSAAFAETAAVTTSISAAAPAFLKNEFMTFPFLSKLTGGTVGRELTPVNDMNQPPRDWQRIV